MSEVITGVLQRIIFRAKDSDFKILSLRTGETVKGQLPESELVTGMTYQFQGNWKNETYRGQKQMTFWANRMVRSEPHSREGVVKYLEKVAPGVGPAISSQLWDLYGEKAVVMLRTEPLTVAAGIRHFPDDVAVKAAEELRKNEKTEEVRIDLMELFAGRGLPHSLTSHVIQEWGITAAQRIRRDPFCLLVNRFKGCGFLRCDELYMDLHRKPWKLKRLMLCIWHYLQSNRDGHTWHDIGSVFAYVQANVSGFADCEDRWGSGKDRFMKAIDLGRRGQKKWLALKKDSESRYWIAEHRSAENESDIASLTSMLIDAGRREKLEEESDHEQLEGMQRRSDVAFHRLANVSDSEMSIEQAIEYGRETGVCQFCARELKTEESKARGYGPTCAKNNGLPWGNEDSIRSVTFELASSH